MLVVCANMYMEAKQPDECRIILLYERHIAIGLLLLHRECTIDVQ